MNSILFKPDYTASFSRFVDRSFLFFLSIDMISRRSPFRAIYLRRVPTILEVTVQARDRNI